MAAKKDRERFTIKFNENDPAHRKVIEILERQGAHSKAPFIVNAILHYIHCPETPDIPVSWLMDKGAIEEMIRGILKEQTTEDGYSKPMVKIQPAEKLQPAAKTQPEEKTSSAVNTHTLAEAGQPPKQPELPSGIFWAEQAAPMEPNTEEDSARALIMNTLSAFRNN